MSTETIDAAYAQNMREIEKLHSLDIAATLSGDQVGIQHRMDRRHRDTRTRRGARSRQAGDSRSP